MRSRPNMCFFVALLFAISCIPVGIVLAFVLGTFMFLLVCVLAVQCSLVGVGLTALTFALSGPLCVASLCTLLVYLMQRFVSCLQYGGGLVTSLFRKRWRKFLRVRRHADGFIRCLGPQYNSLASFISKPTLQSSSGMNQYPTEVDGTFEDGSRVEGTERWTSVPSNKTSSQSSGMARYITSKDDAGPLRYYDTREETDWTDGGRTRRPE